MFIKVSVIIPVYNVERYIERCTRSLMAQTLKDGIEFLFINDCTPDKSVDIIKSVLADFPERRSQVRIIDMPVNSGQGTVRNRGMHEAKGQYVIHCDSDDWVEFDMYEKLLKKAEETNADITVSDFYHEYQNHKEIEVFPNTSAKESILSGVKIWWSLWNRLIKRSLFEENNIYPMSGINCWEDYHFLSKAYYHSNKIVYFHEPLYHYNRTNENSILNSNTTDENLYYMADVSEDLYKYFKYKEDWANKHFQQLNKYLQGEKIARRDKYLKKESYNIEKWKKTYPKTWPYVWNDKSRKLIYRICYMLADFGFTLPLEIRCYFKNR
ncbi:MAG: glycosyltransferase [Prevotella sp.]|nr:glycosyltransferase [Prevotella sp.]